MTRNAGPLAHGEVVLKPETVALIRQGLMKKGDVLTVAQIAGIMAAKKTSELIPLCHPIPIHQVEVNLELDEGLPGVQNRGDGAHDRQDRR